MTTLRTFQNEIDEIHNREVAKQRFKVTVPPDKEKEPRDQKVILTDVAKGKTKDDGKESTPTKPAGSAAVIRSSLLDLEDRILVCSTAMYTLGMVLIFYPRGISRIISYQRTPQSTLRQET